jgi:hypothetical protein
MSSLVSRRTVFRVGATAATLVGATGGAGIANAQPTQQPTDLPGVELEAGRGIVKLTDDFWYVHGGKFEFTVALGARTQGRKRTVRLAVPKGFDIMSINGEKWKVEKVDDTDIEATHPELERPGLKLPKLVIEGSSRKNGVSPLDASVREQAVNYKRKGVKIKIDTSV